MPSIYDFEALQISGKPVPLKQYEGKAMLIVNTASACGFTPQFAGLEDLHKAYAGKGTGFSMQPVRLTRQGQQR